jgi:CBS domain-containing protein
MLTTVRDLLKMKGDALYFVSPETPILKAMQMMAERNIGDLLVLEKGQIVGIVSERDFVHKIAKAGGCDLQAPVSEMMTREVITVTPDQTIEFCMQTMTEEHIRHLPVVEGDQIFGLISIGDVIKGIITSQEFKIDQLEKYISGGSYNQ